MRHFLYLTILWLVSIKTVYALTVGLPAPPFTLPDTGGEMISLSDFRGKHIVLEWFNPDCVRVQQHYQRQTMRQLALKYTGKEVIWLAINSTHYMTFEDNVRWKDVHWLHYRLLGDFKGEVGRRYQAEKTPQIYIINPKGILIYKGAIDSDSIGEKLKPFNYVEAALIESLAGKAVSIPETQPYGCLVKYIYQNVNSE
ncbi:conserved hypothetical protein [Beggiatoa sp. PS]|nr:conserved hypothetical protein [Beggiatoa sp. PS]